MENETPSPRKKLVITKGQWVQAIVLTTFLLVYIFLSFSSVPVPPEKSNYVGNWSSLGSSNGVAIQMSLTITQKGWIRYSRTKEISPHSSSDTTCDGGLKGFEGNNFNAGVWPVNMKFIVTNPPHREGRQWKMVVDGVELTRMVEVDRTWQPDER